MCVKKILSNMFVLAEARTESSGKEILGSEQLESQRCSWGSPLGSGSWERAARA